MRCVLENVIRTCRFYGPQFPPIDVSITMTIRNYIAEVVTMIEDNLNRIFNYLLGVEFARIHVYYSHDRHIERDFIIEDYSVFISAADLISFL